MSGSMQTGGHLLNGTALLLPLTVTVSPPRRPMEAMWASWVKSKVAAHERCGMGCRHTFDMSSIKLSHAAVHREQWYILVDIGTDGDI